MRIILKIFELFIILSVLNRVQTKQISEIKCEETLHLNTSPASHYPHLIELILSDNRGEITSMCIGTLISENYVLTSAPCADFGKLYWNRLRVRKLKLPDENYSNEQVFTIYRYVTHHLYDSTTHIYDDIALLHLNESIPYHLDGSIFRPACLWTNNLLRAAYKYSIYGQTKSIKQIKPVSLITNDECNVAYMGQNVLFYDGIIHSQMCVNTSDQYFEAYSGSPIQANVNSRHYVFGVQSESNKNIAIVIGTKVSRYIKWIESIVWARHKSEISSGGCGERKIKHQPLITYGLPTYHGEFPWHVALFRIEGAQNLKKYICGGTIVNTKIILTAGHCVLNEIGLLPANRLKIVMGEFSVSSESLDENSYKQVDAIIVHEKYNRDYLENDIALVKLHDTIEFSSYVQPICITDNSDYYSIAMGTVAGWGRNENHEQSDVLLKATLPIRINSECRDSNRDFFPNYLNDNNYCAGFHNGTNVCSGDSGGGMIFEHSSRWYIRGIVSLGVALPNSDRCDVIQMILLTDVPKFYDWIVEHLDAN